MTDPVPLSVYLRIGDARRHPFLALLFLASCREFLENPIRQIVISAPQDENLKVLRSEVAFLEGLPIRFEPCSSLSDASFEEPCLVAEPAFFFTRDTNLSNPFMLDSASGSLCFRASKAPVAACDGSDVPAGILSFDECLAANGLIVASKLPQYSDKEIQRIQQAFRSAFSNRAFWNYRYETNPALGSGQGSRGRYATIKRRILNDFVVLPQYSVLDVGCGDLMVVKDLPFAAYTGVDVSERAISNAREMRPGWSFHLGSTEEVDPPEADVVLCFDVLIHQPTIHEARNLLAFLSRHARHRIIVTGYDKPINSHHIVYFHAPLKSLLQELDGWKEPVKLAAYHNMAVYLMDRVGMDDRQFLPAFSILKPARQRPLVTITVNTFNNESQICRCIESISQQSETSLEVHVIDDGSTDGTPKLISSFAASDPRFRLVRDGRNLGISARRNQGLRLGTGSYHLFVDGDDWLADGAVSSLVDLALESGADIVRGSHLNFNLDGQQKFSVNTLDQFHQPEIRGARLADCPSLAMLWVSWNNLIHRRVIADNYLRFAEDLDLGEDRIFMLEAFMAARSITLTKEVTYFWDRSIKSHGNLSLSQNPEQRLLAIRQWLKVAQSDPSVSRRHYELIQVSSFYEIIAMLSTGMVMPEDVTLGCHQILESMDFPPSLLNDRTIKGWRPDTEESMNKVYEDLRRNDLLSA